MNLILVQKTFCDFFFKALKFADFCIAGISKGTTVGYVRSQLCHRPGAGSQRSTVLVSTHLPNLLNRGVEVDSL